MRKSSALKIIRLFIFDVLIVFSSFIISFFLRGVINVTADTEVFSRYANFIVFYVIVILIIKLPLFAIFGMYRRVWKYASIKDMVAIVEASALGTIVMGVLFYVLSQPVPWFGSTFSLPYFPRSILIIDFLIWQTRIKNQILKIEFIQSSKLPKHFWSVIIALIIAILGAVIFFGPSFITEKIQVLNQMMFRPTVGRWNTFPKNYGFSVRCIMN